MKILLVITKADIGGAQSFVLSLAKGLKEKGEDVTVAFGEGEYLPSELSKLGVPYLRLKHLRRSYNPFGIFLLIKELKNILKQNNFEVMHLNSTNTLPGVLAAKLIKKKIKTVFTVHGLSVLDKNYKTSLIIKKLFKAYFKFFLRFMSRIVFVSQYNYEAIKSEGIIKQGEVIYNGLNLHSFHFLERKEAREELEKLTGVSLQDTFVIGSIGRLAYQKNYSYILNNWQKIKQIKENAKLIIIGEGEKRKEYERIIQDNNLEKDVFLPGESKDASKLLKGLDLFILPSIYEGLSISLIETQFAGVPALASDVGGNSEVVGCDNCFTLEDRGKFLEKIKNGVVFNDKKEMFYLDKMVSGYIKIYEV